MYYVLHVCVNLNVIAPILSELYLKEREYNSKCKVEWDFRMFSLGAIVNKKGINTLATLSVLLICVGECRCVKKPVHNSHNIIIHLCLKA